MKIAPVIAISSLLVGFVLLAVSTFSYHMFSKRRKYLDQLAKQGLDLKSSTRIYTVMDGKVVPIRKTKWASAFGKINRHTYSTGQRGSKPTERISRNVVTDLETAVNDCHERSTDRQPQLYYLPQASDLLGCPVYSPLKPLPRIHDAQVKRKRGQHHLEQTLPPKYSYISKSSTIKGYSTASPRPVQKEGQRSTATSKPVAQISLQEGIRTSEPITSKAPSTYALPREPQVSMSSSGPYHVRVRQASNHRPNTITPLANREVNASLLPVPLGLLPPIVKDLPLSPIRTPEDNPTTPVSQRLVLQRSSPKPNFDMTVLQAASVSAIPHSAFYPYRFPCGGPRQPRKSYRAILKSTDTTDSLPIRASSECNANIQREQVGIAPSSDLGPHSAPSRSKPTTRRTGSSPPNESPPPHNASSSDNTQSQLPEPDAPGEAFSWLADPSLSVSAKSSSSSRDAQQHRIKAAKASEESARVVHQSFLDPATPTSGSMTEIRGKHVSSAGPYSAFEIAQAYRMGNARCVSIYSRFAQPVERQGVSARLQKPGRLSAASSRRDKPLPSPRSNHSGHAASASAQSFVVSPLSSTFTR
ncbi:hypothetical protein MMC26_003970 [Xylographa opegraphella]|nr:hypothetical protein [Xylographa opegraphella]